MRTKAIALTAEQMARFWDRAVPPAGGHIDACWLWRGARDRDGYGLITLGGAGRGTRAHRVAWTLTFGPIPDGLNVLHDCPTGDNPSCVNPSHLFLGTHAVNVADKVAKHRQARGERAGRARLTTEQVRAIRQTYGESSSIRRLARAYDMSPAALWNIIQRRTWRHVA